ncbi:MAG: polymerase sigma-B factor, partial [Solirubrobacteraceae bacterium]|nr:polymerase sigma-B factor [Solirubrobacteraceae bacterium]
PDLGAGADRRLALAFRDVGPIPQQRVPRPGPPQLTISRDALRALSTESLFACRGGPTEDAAVEELVTRFEPLARSVARRYHQRGEPLDDLTQVAMVGLLKAISRFDPGRGFAFTTYATPTMVGELKRYFRDSGWAVHVPRGVKERAVELARVTDELSSQLGRSPSLTELAQALGTSEEETLEAIEAYHARHASPLEGSSDDDDSPSLPPARVLGAEDERLEQAEYLSVIAAGVETLSESDRLILYLRFARDLTQSEIAQRVGTSQMQVSRLLRSAIDKIRRASGELDPT